MENAESSDRGRILAMLRGGKITVEEAEKLLDALDAGARQPQPAEEVAFRDARGRKSKKLRIVVDSGAGKDANVNLSIPLSLVRTVGPMVMANIPPEAREQMRRSGVEADTVLDDIDAMLRNNEPGDIVNIDTVKDGAEVKVRIFIE